MPGKSCKRSKLTLSPEVSTKKDKTQKLRVYKHVSSFAIIMIC